MHRLNGVQSGLAGALVLTAVHETVRHRSPEAPRLDVLAERTIASCFEAMGRDSPSSDRLYVASLAVDVATNTAFYSLLGLGGREAAPLRGAMLGLGAGLATVALSPLLGLGRSPANRSRSTQAMTVAWYGLGGLVAGTCYRLSTDR